MHSSPSVLVVGAGAVGQVFARHLQRGGARVTFFVRERHRAEVVRGFDLVRLRTFGRRTPDRLDHCDTVTTAEEVARGRYDQVYLTLPSTGLRGPWLAEFLRALGDATLVATVASAGDREAVLAAGASPEHLVDGLLSLVSYRAPLLGEGAPPGTSYWFPPGGPCLFSGPAVRTDAVVASLSRGGLPARRVDDVPQRLALPTAALMPQLLALEAAGWSLDAFVQPPWAERGARAAREAIAIAGTHAGSPPLGLRLVATRPWLLRAVLRVAGLLTPFPLESYLRAHFTKVAAQTRLLVEATVRRGASFGLPVEALTALLDTVPTPAVEEGIHP